MKKIWISVFIIVSVWMMISSNLPWNKTWHARHLPHTNIQQIDAAIIELEHTLDYLAWLVGLQNIWTMFSPVERMTWNIVYYGSTPETQRELLPLYLQSERTFWQRNFFDFKENRFQNNMLFKRDPFRRYAKYLCTQFTQYSAVVIEAQTQDILPIESPGMSKTKTTEHFDTILCD